MGLFDSSGGGKSYYSSTTEALLNPNAGHGSSASRRGVSPARSTRSVKTSTTGGGYSVRPSASNPHARPQYARSASGSIFGNFGGGGSSSHSNYGGSSSRGIFSSGGGGGSGSSYYKRRPRDGYISYLMHKLQRMIKELWVYARRHPVKAFFAVVVPLLSAGGAIGGLLKQFGIRLPMGMGGSSSSRRSGGGEYYGSRGYGRDSSDSWTDALGGGGGGGGLMGQAGSLLSVAKMFIYDFYEEEEEEDEDEGHRTGQHSTSASLGLQGIRLQIHLVLQLDHSKQKQKQKQKQKTEIMIPLLYLKQDGKHD